MTCLLETGSGHVLELGLQEGGRRNRSKEEMGRREIIRKMRDEGIRGVNSYMDKMNASTKVYFKTRRDAVKSGRRP